MRLLKNTLIYSAGTLANQGVALLLLPVLTRVLAPREYGVVALFSATTAFLMPVVALSMITNINRMYFKNDQEGMARVNFNALFLVSASSFLILTLLVFCGLAFRQGLERVAGIPVGWIFVALLVAFARAIANQLNAFFRIQAQALQFAVFGFVIAALNLGLSGYLVVVPHWGWQGRASGIAISTVLSGIFALLFMRRRGLIKSGTDPVLMKKMLRISLPLVPHTLAAQVTAMSSRLFLNGMINKESVGFFSVGYAFGSILNVPIGAFNNAWIPWVYKHLSNKDVKSDARIVKAFYLVALGLFGLWILVSVALPIILKIVVARPYFEASQFIGLIALSFVFQGMYSLLVPILVDEGRTDSLAIFTVSVAGLSLFLNWQLIRLFGAIGAAWTMVACSSVKLSLVFWYTTKVRPMPWFSAFSV